MFEVRQPMEGRVLDHPVVNGGRALGCDTVPWRGGVLLFSIWQPLPWSGSVQDSTYHVQYHVQVLRMYSFQERARGYCWIFLGWSEQRNQEAKTDVENKGGGGLSVAVPK